MAVRRNGAALGICLLSLACHATADGSAEPRRFEVTGLSEEWLALRENRADRGDTDAERCDYPGLPDSVVGRTIHFLAPTEAMKRGLLVELDGFDASFETHAAPGANIGCTDPATSEKRLAQAHRFAERHGIELLPDPAPLATLGEAVRADTCEAIERAERPGSCGKVFELKVGGDSLRIARALLSVREAPDYVSCQFMGHRFLAAIQISGLGLGEYGALAAPGGFVSHYDCRPQVFLPLQVYEANGLFAILAAFRGENIADASEHVSIAVFPRPE